MVVFQARLLVICILSLLGPTFASLARASLSLARLFTGVVKRGLLRAHGSGGSRGSGGAWQRAGDGGRRRGVSGRVERGAGGVGLLVLFQRNRAPPCEGHGTSL